MTAFSKQPDAGVARVSISFVTGWVGTRFAGVKFISNTRTCVNCAHDGARDPEWSEPVWMDKWGRCMNLCGAADSPNTALHWCEDHQTRAEFDAGVHRPSTPIAHG